jgi:hypothetical protein
VYYLTLFLSKAYLISFVSSKTMANRTSNFYIGKNQKKEFSNEWSSGEPMVKKNEQKDLMMVLLLRGPSSTS